MVASIKAEGISVHFPMPKGNGGGLASSVRNLTIGGMFQSSHGREGITAIEPMNLELGDGDRLGLVGHNGAGKTTLLRVLATILPPTTGRLRIEGRIAALMSISLGLDSLATGYDNIRYRARYMGLSEEEIEEQFEEIAEFTELGDYLALPIKTYSAGMKLRLAFGVSTAFEPHVMILDEWLSAGDKEFQRKAARRFDALVDRTGIVVLASHNGDLLRRVCTKGAVLEHGRMTFLGSMEEALEFERQRRSGA